jgi:hypothetical protein
MTPASANFCIWTEREKLMLKNQEVQGVSIKVTRHSVEEKRGLAQKRVCQPL